MKGYLICLMIINTLCLAANLWVETTQPDFADGTFERNLYASCGLGGSIEFTCRYDLNSNGYIDLFTADRNGPQVKIFWGDASGYTANNVTIFPSQGAGNCDAADLNCDGYVDFLVTHSHQYKISIYWGTPSGPAPDNYLDIPIPTYDGEASYIADLNKDGYLDIITDRSVSGYGTILWGNATGYNYNNRTDLPLQNGQHNIEVADFNKDNWCDILFNGYSTGSQGNNVIYWGSSTGFSASNFTALPTAMGSHGISVADLNKDEFIDIVFTHWYDPRSFIYWGSSTGYSVANMQTLNPGYCYGGSSVADFNNDGYLDIVYHRGGYGIHQQPIYWGSTSGFSDNNISWIGPALETTGGLVADFNSDDYLDIFVNVITPGSYSYVLWGPNFTQYSQLPVNYDHHGMFREIGNIYDRNAYDDYVSSVFDAGGPALWGTIEWDAHEPSGTAILFSVRSGNTPEPDETWSAWCEVSNGSGIPIYLSARYLQYKGRLTYTNPCYLPVLHEVRVTYANSGTLAFPVYITPRTINLNSHGKFTAFITFFPPYDPLDVDITTVLCEGAAARSGHAIPETYIARFEVQDLVGVVPGQQVEFRVTGQLFDGTEFYGVDTIRVIGHDLVFLSCTPNPFRERTIVTVVGQTDMPMTVRIYDVTGKFIRKLCVDRDNPQIVWDRKDEKGHKVPAGVYYLNANGPEAELSKKVILLD